jgi:hypothetical protein
MKYFAIIALLILETAAQSQVVPNATNADNLGGLPASAYTTSGGILATDVANLHISTASLQNQINNTYNKTQSDIRYAVATATDACLPLHGTADDSNKLGGIAASGYATVNSTNGFVSSTGGTFTGTVYFDTMSVKVAYVEDLHVSSEVVTIIKSSWTHADVLDSDKDTKMTVAKDMVMNPGYYFRGSVADPAIQASTSNVYTKAYTDMTYAVRTATNACLALAGTAADSSKLGGSFASAYATVNSTNNLLSASVFATSMTALSTTTGYFDIAQSGYLTVSSVTLPGSCSFHYFGSSVDISNIDCMVAYKSVASNIVVDFFTFTSTSNYTTIFSGSKPTITANQIKSGNNTPTTTHFPKDSIMMMQITSAGDGNAYDFNAYVNYSKSIGQ